MKTFYARLNDALVRHERLLLVLFALWVVLAAVICYLVTGLNAWREWLILFVTVFAVPTLSYMAAALIAGGRDYWHKQYPVRG